MYEFDTDMLPDSEFVDGELKYLATGNLARMLDTRRTPVRVLETRVEPGFFVAEVLDFEDKGARWELPFEWVSSFQFSRDSAEARADQVAAYSRAIARLDKPLTVPVDPVAREATEALVDSLRRVAASWLDADSGLTVDPSPADSDAAAAQPELWDVVRGYMNAQGLWSVEDAFAATHVSNPYSGEMVKGHSIVLAELGLVPFEGKKVRDTATFSAPFTKSRRADHIVHRLALVRELFARLERPCVALYRGAAFNGPAVERSHDSFLSATFDREVALELFDDRGASENGVLIRQSVPAVRLFMTCVETEQLNRQYSESEVILLRDPENALF